VLLLVTDVWPLPSMKGKTEICIAVLNNESIGEVQLHPTQSKMILCLAGWIFGWVHLMDSGDISTKRDLGCHSTPPPPPPGPSSSG
jgi:hypothetical protein